MLFAFLYEWRVALISCIAMPLSLLAAGLVLYYMGATINTMILAGFVIALGDIVDDAIIDIENVVRRLRAAAEAGPRQVAQEHGPDHSRSLARSPRRDRLRHADRSLRHPAGVLHGRACPARSSSRWPWRTPWRCWCR